MENSSIRHLTPEQEHTGFLLVRRCDALDVLQMALDAFEEHEEAWADQDMENARDELRILQETAEGNLWLFKQRHNIPE